MKSKIPAASILQDYNHRAAAAHGDLRGRIQGPEQAGQGFFLNAKEDVAQRLSVLLCDVSPAGFFHAVLRGECWI